MNRREFENEKQYLQKVYQELDRQLEESKESTKSYKERLKQIRSSLWDDHGISSASDNKMMDIAQEIAELHQRGSHFGLQYENYKKLKAIEDKPFFARMDFHEEDQPMIEQLYLGIRSLIDEKSNEPLIYDWRAPISSMFYDYGLGSATYEGPGGLFRGEISLKRQFRIEDRELVYMFDNELKIDDEVLQEALAKHADEKMRTIVNTIQKEQNRAIRNDEDGLLLVEGPAGSGKTSVALHRIAYLLYRFRNSISSQNIVVFSPSRIFSDYISHVLPELGEENVFQTTFQDYAERFLGWDWDVESQMEAMESILQENDFERQKHLRNIAFKSSATFEEILQRLVSKITKEASYFLNIVYADKLVISAEEQEFLYNENYSYLPVNKRLEKIYQRIIFLLKPIKKQHFDELMKELEKQFGDENNSWWTLARLAVGQMREELNPILIRLRKHLRINSFELYKKLLTDNGEWSQVSEGISLPENADQSLANLDRGLIAFEDTIPLLYLIGELEGYPSRRKIRHVVVDEVQDYSPLQIKILTNIFPRANFTFVGDIFQSLNPYVWQSGKDSLEQLFRELNFSTVKLTKSYRSSKEIFNFLDSILEGKSQAETVLRSGNLPQIILTEKSNQLRAIKEHIDQCRSKGYKTIAIICPTTVECSRLHEELINTYPDLGLSVLTKENEPFRQGLVLLPVFLAKGLEFDAVILPNVSAEVYSHEDHRHLFYVACSRALHELRMVSAEELSPFISGANNCSYDVVELSCSKC